MLSNVLKLISFAFINVVAAQNATSTATAPASTYTVAVGADGFNFSPHQVNANVGDIIQFRFYPQNHSVARAAFGPNPCIPYEDTGPGLVGFWSGFRPVALVLNNPPIFNLRVNDTQPIFYYCSAPGACLQGMIGVINPNTTETFEAQFNYTQNATTEFSPLQYFPAEVPFSRTTTATGATATATAVPTSSSTPSSSSHSSLGTGPIVGIAIGGFAVLVLAAALIYMCGRQKTFSEMLRHSQSMPSPHTSYQPTSPGVTEAKYSNMLHNSPDADKPPFTNNYNMPVGETESYRSMSPPVGNGSPGLSVFSPNSPGFSNASHITYNSQVSHEMDNRNIAAHAGLRPYNPVPENEGPHELPSNSTDSPNTIPSTTESRPFSYTDSETGFSTDRKR